MAILFLVATLRVEAAGTLAESAMGVQNGNFQAVVLAMGNSICNSIYLWLRLACFPPAFQLAARLGRVVAESTCPCQPISAYARRYFLGGYPSGRCDALFGRVVLPRRRFQKAKCEYWCRKSDFTDIGIFCTTPPDVARAFRHKRNTVSGVRQDQ